MPKNSSSDLDFRAYRQALLEQGSASDQASKQGPGGNRLAMFDLDRTLVAGYTFHAFVFEIARRGRPNSRMVLKNIRKMLEYGTHRIDFTEMLAQVAEELTGADCEATTRMSREVFTKYLQSSIYREAAELVAAHRRLGHRLVMVTSATRYQAEPIAEYLGFDDLYCSELESSDGKLTGRLLGKPCFGEGKAEAGRQAAKHFNCSLQDAWFYTDSTDDLPLLNIVGQPVAVNPQPALAKIARKRAWPALSFKSRRAASIAGAVRTGMLCQGLVGSALAGAATYALTLSPQEARNRMTSMLGDIGTLYAGMDLEIEGQEFLEAARPAVFIFNHQSYLDAVILARLLRHDITAFCKKELANTPVLGSIMRANGAIFVDREDARAARSQLKSAAEVIRAGRSVAIAPEGTRSMSQQVAPFKHGAFVLARQTEVPVVPVILHNSGDALPRGKICVNPTTVKVTVLPPTQLHNCSREDFNARIGNLEQQYRETIAAAAV
ncbi:MAG: HAD-IB family hydrolase [Gammaproteobacteria bacterium]|nr:HAD-IB family hydrolase [Gammaproteobacteria bacterium]